ncbi:MAG: acyl-CoA dehydrogenase family protein [Thermodesulfobacteriota bacterium]
MNFDLTEEHRMIRDMARKFADEVIAPRAEEMERTGEYPYDIIAQMGELGMMGLPYPEEYGGSGGDWVGTMLCIEEIARGDITVGALLEVTTGIAAQEVFAFGTEEQKKKWLVPLVEGKEIGAFGLTEPDSGSDAASLKTTAVLDGDEWILNGTKRFITNIGLNNATILLAAAKVKTAQGDVISTFIVPKTAKGFKLGTPYRKLSWHASATSEVILEDCRIPRENILGDPNRGFAQHLAVLETGRIGIAAMSVGLAQACYDHALRYAQERTQFGQPIYNFQAVQFKLADMAVAIELARNEYIKAAWLKDQGRPHTFETTIAKLYASEMVEKVASDAFQIHGGYGFMEEYAVSRFYASAKVLQIVDGTSEVQRMILGRMLGSRSDSRIWV